MPRSSPGRDGGRDGTTTPARRDRGEAGNAPLWTARSAPAIAEPCGEDRNDVVVVTMAVGGEDAALGIASARAVGAQDGFAVSLTVCTEDARRLCALTVRNIGQPMTMRHGARVIARPLLTEPIMGGRLLVSGDFTAAEAADLAAFLPDPSR